MYHRISDIMGEEINRTAGRAKTGFARIGRFNISNPEGTPFILRITLDNAGALRLEEDYSLRRGKGGERHEVGLRNLELRYRNQSEVLIRRRVTTDREAPRPRGGQRVGSKPDRQKPQTRPAPTATSAPVYVYEVEFLEEEMQPRYKMELWAFLNEDGSRPPGTYHERITFEIEPKYPPPAVVDTLSGTGDAESKKRRLRWGKR